MGENSRTRMHKPCSNNVQNQAIEEATPTKSKFSFASESTASTQDHFGFFSGEQEPGISLDMEDNISLGYVC